MPKHWLSWGKLHRYIDTPDLEICKIASCCLWVRSGDLSSSGTSDHTYSYFEMAFHPSKKKKKKREREREEREREKEMVVSFH